MEMKFHNLLPNFSNMFVALDVSVRGSHEIKHAESVMFFVLVVSLLHCPQSCAFFSTLLGLGAHNNVINSSVADLREGPGEPGPPLFWAKRKK